MATTARRADQHREYRSDSVQRLRRAGCSRWSTRSIRRPGPPELPPPSTRATSSSSPRRRATTSQSPGSPAPGRWAGGTAAVTLAAGGTTSATVQGLVTVSPIGVCAVCSGLRHRSQHRVITVDACRRQRQHRIRGKFSAQRRQLCLQQLENVGAQLGALQQASSSDRVEPADHRHKSDNRTVGCRGRQHPAGQTQLTQQQILQQAGVSALSQSNALQQSFLKLLNKPSAERETRSRHRAAERALW